MCHPFLYYCPYCGANKADTNEEGEVFFSCGTHMILFDSWEVLQSNECIKRTEDNPYG
jgi:hypothetical protein